MILPLLAALAASGAIGTPVAAHSCENVNSGMQYFSMQGFRTAAVIEDGMLEIDLSGIFDVSVRLGCLCTMSCMQYSAMALTGQG